MSDGPLSGLRVLDLTTMISGGFATVMFADFGADVVSVEHPEILDPLRTWTPNYEGESMWWKSLGRNKRCVTLDLSTAEGREVCLELAADADVVVENFRAGTMERWGLSYDDFREVNEGIVMTRISGYGQYGPRSDKPGFGTVAECISGWAHANGFPDSPPLLPPIPLADLTAAQFAVMSTMFAVFERMTGGGEGQEIDVSLYEPLFRLFIGDVEAYDGLGTVLNRTGNRSTNSAPRNLYETADGYLGLSASAQQIFERVMRAIGREDLIDDPRFADNERRLQNVEELDAVIEEWTRERPTDEAIEVLEEHDAIVGPVYDMADIVEDEQYRARETVTEVDDPDVGTIKTHNVVPELSRTPGDIDHLGAAHGAHNEEVYLDELGMGRERYDRLREEGVI